MHKLTAFSLLPLFTACLLDAKNIGAPEADASASVDGTATGPAESSDTEPTVAGPSDPGTDPEPVDTDTATGGEQCVEPDLATVTEFAVTLDAWPDQFDDFHNFTHDCTIDEVTSDGTTVTTALTCDVDGAPRGATFTISAAPEGDVDWAAGLAVTLEAHNFGDFDYPDFLLHMALAGDPAALLVHGVFYTEESIPVLQQIGPIARERVAECDLSPDDDDIDTLIYQLAYTLTDGPSVAIWSGHRASLAIDADHTFVIDLGVSGNAGFNSSERSLLRRVKL